MTRKAPVVLLVEDEPEMRKILRVALVADGYVLHETDSVWEALSLTDSHHPEIILLDLGLPDGDGIVLTRRLREHLRTPIIVLSARGREDDKVEALDAGADDYLTKPFGVNELLARMRVALRHAGRSAADAPQEAMQFGELRVDLRLREVTRAGTPIRLTRTEYRLLELFVVNAGRVLTHRQILKEVWGPSNVEHTHYVRVYMGELRKKIEVDPSRPQIIVTEPGVGYRLRAQRNAT